MRRRSFLALATGLAAAGLAAAPLARASVWPRRPWRLDLVNAHTGESFQGPYRDDKGPIADAVEQPCYFLRDVHGGERTGIDLGVRDFLVRVREAVGAPPATCRPCSRSPR